MTKALLIDRDRLMNFPRKAVAQATVKLFSAIQDFAKERQLLALACAFVLLCDACNIPAQDVFTASKNLMVDERHHTRLSHEFAAMGFHLKTDVLNQG